MLVERGQHLAQRLGTLREWAAQHVANALVDNNLKFHALDAKVCRDVRVKDNYPCRAAAIPISAKPSAGSPSSSTIARLKLSA